MYLQHPGAEFLKALGHRVIVQVGAAHLEPEVKQHFGDTAHSGAAYAHKMHAFDFVFHASANLMHSAATVRVASGLLTARAFCAMPSKASRVKLRSNSASRGGRSSGCGTSTAAPHSTRKCALDVWWSSAACGNGTNTLAMPAAA